MKDYSYKYAWTVYTNSDEDYYMHSLFGAIEDISRIFLYNGEEYHGVLCVL